MFVRSLDELTRALPLQLAGLDAGQIERSLDERVRQIRAMLSDRQVLELKRIDETAAGEGRRARGRPAALA